MFVVKIFVAILVISSCCIQGTEAFLGNIATAIVDGIKNAVKAVFGFIVNAILNTM
jgi:hypothetical protein